ncbi:MAG: NAD-dependent epimerase/dehydratase family protein [Bacteroidota bacterium]
MQKILVTGFGGFIGYSLVKELQKNFAITAFDNFSDFSNYDIKRARAGQLGIQNFDVFKRERIFRKELTTFHYADLCNVEQLEKIFSETSFDLIIHLAALTGVRQSLLNPRAYLDSNIKGFVNLLECANKFDVRKIIYASSSSVYGLNDETPFNFTFSVTSF